MASKIAPFLSRRGQEIVYPRQGLLLQGQQASKTRINATIGVAFDEQQQHFCYSYLRQAVPSLNSEQLVGYASSFGLSSLRERWREQLISKNPSLAGKPFSNPVVTAAITHSLSIASYLFAEEKTPLLLPHLFWPNYRLIFAQDRGAELRTYPTFTADQHFNLAGLDQLLASPEPRKIVLFNCPNNPTGYSLLQHEVDQLVVLLRKHADTGQKIVVLCDDAYYGLNYQSDIAHETAFAQLADAHPGVLAVKHDGITKEDFGWGLRIGFITFAGAGLAAEDLAALEDKAGAVVRGNVSNISRPTQELLLKLFQENTHLEEQQHYRKLIKDRYFQLCSIFQRSQTETAPYFQLLPCNSGYFMALELLQGKADQLRRHLIDHYSTGVIAFGERYIRLAFSTVKLDDLEQLAKNLLSACQDVFGRS